MVSVVVDSDIEFMTRLQLKAEILRLRMGIRQHRDQRLDDRCWMDDFELYEILPEGLEPSYVDLRLLPKEVMMANCDRFTTCRTLAATPEEAITTYRNQLTKVDGDGKLGS